MEVRRGHVAVGVAAGIPLTGEVGTDARILLTDAIHGDLIGLADPTTGEMSASATYQPYGELGASAGLLPLGYQGGWTDPDTDQVNAHARWYDPDSGAFTSRDTWTLQPDPTPRANRYVYGVASPLRNADPTGHDHCVVIPAFGLEWPPGCSQIPEDCLIAAHPCPGDGEHDSSQSPKAGKFGAAPSVDRGIGTAPPVQRGFGAAPGRVDPPGYTPPGYTPPEYGPPPIRPRPQPWSDFPDRGRPEPVDPTDGDGILNPPTVVDPDVTEGIDDVGDLPPPDDELTEHERQEVSRCRSGDWDKDPIFYWNRNYTIYQEVGIPRGVASGAEACYSSEDDLKGGTRAKYTPPGYEDGVGLNRGHLIAKSLGGSGSDPKNVTPICGTDNRSMYRDYERLVHIYVKLAEERGASVYYRVVPYYHRGNPVPHSIRIVIVPDVGEITAKTFRNEFRDGRCKSPI